MTRKSMTYRDPVYLKKMQRRRERGGKGGGETAVNKNYLIHCNLGK